MRRLYVRVYLAMLASLAVFAVAAGILWRLAGDAGPAGRAIEAAATLARNALPPAAAPPAEQQAALARLAAGLQADVALYAPDRTLVGAVGVPPPAPDARRGQGWWRAWGGPSAAALRLPDGRWLVARLAHEPRRRGAGLFLGLALLALAVAVGAYPVVRRLTRRLERLQAGVESLGAGDLAARVPVEGRDEVALLARSFNHAAARIETLVGAHRTLLAHASHELRTPLARIRLGVELMKEHADPARKRDLEQDIAEMDALLDEILLASRLEAVPERAANEEVDLLALATEEAARDDAVAVAGEPVTVRGDGRLLRRMIRNLLDNARRHGRPPIEVLVRPLAGGAELRVTDHGPGVPEAEREAVFRPFYRFQGAGEGTGTGLGLALVRQIAHRHGGDARCLAGPGAGFVVTLGAPARDSAL